MFMGVFFVYVCSGCVVWVCGVCDVGVDVCVCVGGGGGGG